MAGRVNLRAVRAEQPADPRRVYLDDKDRERLNKQEFSAMRGMLAELVYIESSAEYLRNRLECIPGGKQRTAMLRGSVNAITDDLLGTVPREQCLQLGNTMNDMELRMVPKMTPMTRNVVIEESIAKGIIDMAKEKCKFCVEDNESCRSCRLYQYLVAILPLDSYDNGLQCPYSNTIWK